jgi:FlaA1/EpsC-like NDP-sugar epimerase
MSIEEAAQLIIQAGAMGNGSRAISSSRWASPSRSRRWRMTLIKLAGKDPETEIEIVYTGLREGEKLYEELISEGEGLVPTGHDQISGAQKHQ